MPSRPWRPKSWVTPKTPFRRERLHSIEILKETYPEHGFTGGPVMERSWAAKLARDRRWISWGKYFSFPLEDTGRVAPTMFGLYDENPLFKLLKKVDFAS